MPQLEITLNEDPRVDGWVLALDGTATYHQAPRLRRELLDAVARAPRRLIVDLEGIEHMDTVATAVLVESLLQSRVDDGPEIFFCSPSESVEKVFKLSGLTEALEHCESCRAHLEAKLRAGKLSTAPEPATESAPAGA